MNEQLSEKLSATWRVTTIAKKDHNRKLVSMQREYVK